MIFQLISTTFMSKQDIVIRTVNKACAREPVFSWELELLEEPERDIVMFFLEDLGIDDYCVPNNSFRKEMFDSLSYSDENVFLSIIDKCKKYRTLYEYMVFMYLMSSVIEPDHHDFIANYASDTYVSSIPKNRKAYLNEISKFIQEVSSMKIEEAEDIINQKALETKLYIAGKHIVPHPNLLCASKLQLYKDYIESQKKSFSKSSAKTILLYLIKLLEDAKKLISSKYLSKRIQLTIYETQVMTKCFVKFNDTILIPVTDMYYVYQLMDDFTILLDYFWKHTKNPLYLFNKAFVRTTMDDTSGALSIIKKNMYLFKKIRFMYQPLTSNYVTAIGQVVTVCLTKANESLIELLVTEFFNELNQFLGKKIKSKLSIQIAERDSLFSLDSDGNKTCVICYDSVAIGEPVMMCNDCNKYIGHIKCTYTKIDQCPLCRNSKS